MEPEIPQSPTATREDLEKAVSSIKSSMPSSGIGFIGVMFALFIMHSCTADSRDAHYRDTKQQLEQINIEVKQLRQEIGQMRKENKDAEQSRSEYP